MQVKMAHAGKSGTCR